VWEVGEGGSAESKGDFMTMINVTRARLRLLETGRVFSSAAGACAAARGACGMLQLPAKRVRGV